MQKREPSSTEDKTQSKISVRFPEAVLQQMRKLVTEKRFMNVADVIRHSVYNFLGR